LLELVPEGKPPLKRAPAPIRGEIWRNHARADAVIEFIETLTVPTGEGEGRKFKVRPWQAQFIRDIYEPHDATSDRRLVRRAILSMARKNGKTALIACLVLAHLAGPEQVKNGEIYSAANDRDQAALIFRVCKQIIEADERIWKFVKVLGSHKTITNFSNGTVYKAITSESGTKHGLNPTLVIYDELAQAKNRDLYDVLDTSMGARKEPLFIAISTQSHDPEHVFSLMIDDALSGNDVASICHLYEVPVEEKDVFNPACWPLANPALGDFRDYEDLKNIAEKAARLPAEEPKFRNLYLNQRVSAQSSLIRRQDWEACAGECEFKDGEEIWLSLDLSGTVDLTALIMGSADEKTRIRPFMWKPASNLRDHSDRDFGSGNQRYREWATAGYLLTTPGRTVNPEAIAMQVAELQKTYKVLGLVFDRWGITALQREFDRIGLQTYEDNEKGRGAGLRLIPWGQGYKDMGPAVSALETAVLDRKLEHPNNPLLNWTIANAIVTTDPAGARKLDKEKAKFRIDPAVALAMLLGAKARHRTKAPEYKMMFFG
jgi:phage terminase large subunit-like protein